MYSFIKKISYSLYFHITCVSFQHKQGIATNCWMILL